MTYLELCRVVARESGTVPSDTAPATVTGQTGRLGDIVRWVDYAWWDVQNYRADWRWMMREFTGAVTAGKAAYTGGEIGLTDHAEWVVLRERSRDCGLSIFETAAGAASEQPLAWIDYEPFRRRYVRGEHEAALPAFVTVDPENRLRLGPTPSVACTIRGRYRKTPQRLAADGDVPAMPERFHLLIVDRALDYLGTKDEAVAQTPAWGARAARRLNELQRDTLPPMLHPGALA